MDKEAFWFKDGTIIQVDDGTGHRHIDDVAAHPAAFGVTPDYIKSMYAKHGEPVGFEGKAREEIFARLMLDGWVRIRHRAGKRDSWIVQCADMERQKGGLAEIARHLIIEDGRMRADDVVLVTDLDGNSARYDGWNDKGKGFLHIIGGGEPPRKVRVAESYGDFCKNAL